MYFPMLMQMMLKNPQFQQHLADRYPNSPWAQMGQSQQPQPQAPQGPMGRNLFLSALMANRGQQAPSQPQTQGLPGTIPTNVMLRGFKF